jgi:hypothetical protein
MMSDWRRASRTLLVAPTSLFRFVAMIAELATALLRVSKTSIENAHEKSFDVTSGVIVNSPGPAVKE